METLVILAAAAATLLACLFVATLSKGPGRPPLRLPREEEWDDDAEAVSKMLTPPQASPIDQTAQVLDARTSAFEAGAGDLGRQGADPRIIDGHVIEGGRAAAEPRTFDPEELDSRMLDQLLDQQNRELKRLEERDGPPPSPEARDRTAR